MNLIWLEFAVRQGKICNTTPMLASPLNQDKLKLFDQMRELRRKMPPVAETGMPHGEFTFVTVLTL